MPESEPQEFQPVLLSRRGEWTAWALVLAASAGIWLLARSGITPLWAWFFWGFLLFSASSISLGNWVDRNTVLQLEADGIRFRNGLRHVRLQWPEIQKVAVLPARWGKSVQVIGEQSHFEFRTLGEVQFQGEVRGQTGFPDGQVILDTILREAGLVLVEESNNAYYYARS